MNWSEDFNQIRMDITLGHDEELIRFGDIDLIFKVTTALKLLNFSQKVFVCISSHEPLTGMLPILHVCIIEAHHIMVWVVGTSVFSENTVMP